MAHIAPKHAFYEMAKLNLLNCTFSRDIFWYMPYYWLSIRLAIISAPNLLEL